METRVTYFLTQKKATCLHWYLTYQCAYHLEKMSTVGTTNFIRGNEIKVSKCNCSWFPCSGRTCYCRFCRWKNRLNCECCQAADHLVCVCGCVTVQNWTSECWSRNLLLASCDWDGLLADFDNTWVKQHNLNAPINKELWDRATR